jgi:hypothetical protein
VLLQLAVAFRSCQAFDIADLGVRPDARPDESGFLSAFDTNRDLICAAAARIYVRGSRGSYDLVAANF